MKLSPTALRIEAAGGELIFDRQTAEDVSLFVRYRVRGVDIELLHQHDASKAIELLQQLLLQQHDLAEREFRYAVSQLMNHYGASVQLLGAHRTNQDANVQFEDSRILALPQEFQNTIKGKLPDPFVSDVASAQAMLGIIFDGTRQSIELCFHELRQRVHLRYLLTN